MLVAAEISAAATVIQYWTTAVPVAVWITIILIVVVFLNIFVVSIYGEAEFWFARSVQLWRTRTSIDQEQYQIDYNFGAYNPG